MKNLPSLIALAVALLVAPGCKSPEQAAYRATGSIIIAVDSAMQGWGDYVRAGLATPEEEAKVRLAYERYQASIRLARTMADAYTSDQVDKVTIDTTFSALDMAKNDLLTLIQSFRKSTTPKPQATP